MSTDIFRSKDAMPGGADPMVVRPHTTLEEQARFGGQPLPGYRKNPMDVVNTRERPQATGRRP